MNSGLSGFYNAGVTKVVVVSSAILSLLVGSQGAANYCALSYQAVVEKRELWRLLSSSIVFNSTPEVIFGLYLVYFFRVFERQVGPNKYAVFALFSTLISSLLQVAALTILKDVEHNLSLAPGPYGLIFASFVPFCFDIPVSTRFNVFTVHLSDKSFVYLAGLQLLLSSWKQSLVPGIAGILAGFLYRANVVGIRKLKFPEFIASSAGRLFAPLLSRSPSAPATRSGGTRTPGANGPGRPPVNSQGFQDQLLGGGDRFPPPMFGGPNRGNSSVAHMGPQLLPPSEEAVATLEAMGFDRSAALRALAQARNDVTLATNLLVESQVG